MEEGDWEERDTRAEITSCLLQCATHRHSTANVKAGQSKKWHASQHRPGRGRGSRMQPSFDSPSSRATKFLALSHVQILAEPNKKNKKR